MKKLLLFLIPLSLILTSCGADPVKYNDSLVDFYDDANNRVNSLYDIASDDMQSGNFAKLTEYAKTTVDSLKLDIEKINALEKPSGSNEFHNSVVSYVESLVTYVNALGEQYSQVNDSTTDEEFSKIEEVVDNVSKINDQKRDAMIEAQKAFAKAKNFDLK